MLIMFLNAYPYLFIGQLLNQHMGSNKTQNK